MRVELYQNLQGRYQEAAGATRDTATQIRDTAKEVRESHVVADTARAVEETAKTAGQTVPRYKIRPDRFPRQHLKQSSLQEEELLRQGLKLRRFQGKQRHSWRRKSFNAVFEQNRRSSA